MKTPTSFFIPVLVSLILSASCSIAGENQSPQNLNQVAEPLYGIQLNQGKVAINVKSNGCTESAHFSVRTSVAADHQELLIVRDKSDRCRKMPRIIRIELDLPSTVKGGYRLVNPLQSG